MSGAERECERCGAKPKGFDLLDYCAECSRDLCDACMEKGCCGHVPAKSGEVEDVAELPTRAQTASGVEPIVADIARRIANGELESQQ